MGLLTPEQMEEVREYYKTLPEQTVDFTATRSLERIQIRPLHDYPRARRGTRRGMHGTAEVDRPFGSEPGRVIDELYTAGFDGITLLMNPGGDTIDLTYYALDKGMWSSIRMYRDQPNPGGLTGEQKETLIRVAPKLRGKASYIITNNEHDLPLEWQGGRMPANWLEVVARHTIEDARFVQSLGLIFVLPAAATGSPGFYQNRLIPKMLELGGADVFSGLIMVGVHDYTVGHPVGGIEFENDTYPYDDVNQAGRALSDAEFRAYGDVWRAWETDNPANVSNERARNKNPGQKHTDLGGSAGVIALWHQYEINAVAAGLQGLPVISTEGGEWHDTRNDGRYPRTSPDLRAKRMLEIARRCRGTSTTRWNYPDYFIGNADWLLEDDRAGSPWQNGGYYSFGQVRSEYRQYFMAHKAIMEGATPPPPPPPTPPPPDPEEPTPPTTEREVINKPEWVTFIEPVVSPGAEYWELTRFEFWDEAQSQGKQNIYILDPHDPALKIKVENYGAGQTWEQALDKPAPEWNNVPMWGIGNKYQVSMVGLPGVAVRGMELRGNRHICYLLTFAKRRKQEAPAPPAPTLRTLLLAEAERRIAIEFNPDAGLQKVIFAGDLDQFTPNSPEFWITHEGKAYVAQRAENGRGTVRVYYSLAGDWDNVKYVERGAP